MVAKISATYCKFVMVFNRATTEKVDLSLKKKVYLDVQRTAA